MKMMNESNEKLNLLRSLLVVRDWLIAHKNKHIQKLKQIKQKYDHFVLLLL